MLLGKVKFTRIINTMIMRIQKCAEIEGTTTREMYKKFGVDIED